MTDQDPSTLLRPLFSKAQATDEFEFCCSLLRFRGLQSAGWDPLAESLQLMNQVMLLTQAPIDSLFRLRLSLFLYCHATEIDDLYDVIGNLLRVCKGERYSMSPFAGSLHPSHKDAKNPAAKVSRILEWSREVGFPAVGEEFEFMMVKQVRNAFFHSDYTLYDNEFRMKHGKPIQIGEVQTPIVPIDWLVPRMERGINLVLATIELIHEFRRSYTQEKRVRARILPNDVEQWLVLTVHPDHGLRGFRGLTEEESKQ
jgi:hypothetical protein